MLGAGGEQRTGDMTCDFLVTPTLSHPACLKGREKLKVIPAHFIVVQRPEFFRFCFVCVCVLDRVSL